MLKPVAALASVAMLALAACAPAAAPAPPTAAPKPTEAAKPAAPTTAAPAAQPTQPPKPVATTAPAAAQPTTAAPKPATKYPTRTLVFSTHSNPGGGGDLLGRQLVEALKAQGINGVLENRAGGSGAINMAYVASRPPDGHTVLIVTLSNLITPHLAGTELDYKNFKPVARLQTEDEAIMVHKDAPYRSIEEVVDAAKKGGVKFGGGFVGNIDSFVAFQLANRAGFTIEYVPFEGGGETTTALLGKHIDVAVTNPAESMTQLQSGDFKMLATTGAQRAANFKDVPTLKEKGYDIVQEQWRGVWLHKDTPDEMVTQLADVLKKAMAEPSFQKYTADGMLNEAFLGPAEFALALEAQDKEVSSLVDQFGIRDKDKKP